MKGDIFEIHYIPTSHLAFPSSLVIKLSNRALPVYVLGKLYNSDCAWKNYILK